MGNRMNEKGFPNCVGITDGTLLPLMLQPQRRDYADFFNRHHKSSFTTMLICTDCREIIYHNSGWPGSLHDQRVFSHSSIYNKPQQYFSPGEFLIGDAGYTNTKGMITSYRMPAGAISLPPDRSFFNRAHARARITIEHTIGLLKGRFPFLRCIPLRVTQNNNTVLKVVRFIEAIICIHNIMHDFSEGDCDKWIKEQEAYNKKNNIVSDFDAVYELEGSQDPSYNNPSDEAREVLCVMMNRNPTLTIPI
jgi:hypothetical protein